MLPPAVFPALSGIGAPISLPPASFLATLSGKSVYRERLRHVVVEVHAENVRPYPRALEMMPVIFVHEELSAVARVMIAVRTAFVAPDSRAAIGARPGLQLMNLRIIFARKVQPGGDRYEFALIDRANSGFFLNERLEFQARVRRYDTHGHARRPGLRTFARLIFKNALFTPCGAYVGDGRQSSGNGRLGDDADVMQCGEVAVVDLRGYVIADFHRYVIRLLDAIVHRHRPHPAGHIVTADGQHSGASVDLFHLAAKRMLLVCVWFSVWLRGGLFRFRFCCGRMVCRRRRGGLLLRRTSRRSGCEDGCADKYSCEK